MTLLKGSCTACITICLLACGQQQDPEGVIPQGYEKTVEKAQGIESALQDQARSQLESLDQAE